MTSAALWVFLLGGLLVLLMSRSWMWADRERDAALRRLAWERDELRQSYEAKLTIQALKSRVPEEGLRLATQRAR